MGFMSKEGVFMNSKSMVSSLYGHMMRLALGLQSLIGDTKINQTHRKPSLPGLKTLIYSQKEPHQTPIFHFYMISPSQSPSTSPPPLSSSSSSSATTTSSLFKPLAHSSSWSSLIGTESGVYMRSNEEEMFPSRLDKPETRGRYQAKRKSVMASSVDYPPPIPLLARTGNLSGHMPWILTRHYSNGKLVLNLQRVKHHDYFEAYRENGRLILNLVPMDDAIKNNDDNGVHEDQEEELGELAFIEEEKDTETEVEDWCIDSDDDDNDKKIVDHTVREGPMAIINIAASSWIEKGSERCGDLRRCFTYCDKLVSEQSLFYEAKNNHENATPFFDQSSSSPLHSVRPMTTVAA